MIRSVCVLALLAGCYDDNLVPCGDNVCPRGKLCASDLTCVSQSQLDACAGRADGDPCTDPAGGTCRTEVCIAGGCGNGVVESTELCDDGNRNSGDGCRGDCASRELCGDGVVDFAVGEQCDCLAASGACSGPNADTPDASCRTDCLAARCGDAIVDTFELCDDGNAAPGDGCRADCAGRFTKLQPPTGRDVARVIVDADSLWMRVDNGIVHRLRNGAWSVYNSLGSHDFVPIGDDLFMCGFLGSGNLVLRHVPAPGGTMRSDRTLAVAGATRCSLFGTSADNIYVLTADTNGFTTHVAHSTAVTLVDVTTQVDTACSSQSTFTPAYVGAIGDGTATGIYLYGRNGVCRIASTANLVVTGALMPGSPSILKTPSIPGGLVRDPVSGNLFAIANAGVYRWDGTTWTPPDPANLIPGQTIAWAASGPDSVLAVGDNGLVLELVGSTYTHLVAPTELSLTTVTARSPTEVFIGGVGGTLMY